MTLVKLLYGNPHEAFTVFGNYDTGNHHPRLSAPVPVHDDYTDEVSSSTAARTFDSSNIGAVE